MWPPSCRIRAPCRHLRLGVALRRAAVPPPGRLCAAAGGPRACRPGRGRLVRALGGGLALRGLPLLRAPGASGLGDHQVQRPRPEREGRPRALRGRALVFLRGERLPEPDARPAGRGCAPLRGGALPRARRGRPARSAAGAAPARRRLLCRCVPVVRLLLVYSAQGSGERFLVPAYPLLAFAAAFAACGGAAALSEVARRAAPGLARSAVVRLLLRVDVAFMLATGALSASRTLIAALHTGYAAPVGIYAALGEQLSSLRASRGAGPIHACLGAEWHRFMTSFFLPHHDDHLSYVRFGPTGLLPAEFNVSVGTSGVPPFMNDLNREEPSRYVDADRCDFLIDVDLGEAQGDIPALRSRALRTLAEAPFLDASRSRFPWRAFYVPGISKQKNVYASYRLLQLAPVARVA
ncbi:unnamed protein product [Prorocentrum cordatum]|uniref:Mannosyltransferase n=1 Tax=Prorocentrum cordatum TaxID=2364126 RepID=A0ABN9SFF6_9DINO|nr:unnamed protein product [Polarella glacialis]